MKRLSIIAFTLLSLVAKAQPWPFEFWYDGRIVLVSGDTLKGQVKYNLQQDLLQFNVSNQVYEAYSARKVMFFEIFDTSTRDYRIFFSIPYVTTGNYKAPVFFELLAEGKMTLLAREAVENKTYTSPYFIGASYTRQVLVYHYYFLDDRGDVMEHIGKWQDIRDRMGRWGEEVEKHMRANRLNPEDKSDLKRIIKYYNSLAQP